MFDRYHLYAIITLAHLFSLKKFFGTTRAERFGRETLYEEDSSLRQGRNRQVDDDIQPLGRAGGAGAPGDADRVRPQSGLDQDPDGGTRHSDRTGTDEGGCGFRTTRGYRLRGVWGVSVRGVRRPDPGGRMRGARHHSGIREARGTRGLREVPAGRDPLRRSGGRRVRRVRHAHTGRLCRPRPDRYLG